MNILHKRLAIILFFIVMILTQLLVKNYYAQLPSDPIANCIFIGGPDYECPYSYWENCYCEPIIVE